MESYQSVAIIIPSLSPDDKLITLLSDLREAGFERLLVVNDGSSADCDPCFQTARDSYGCTVLVHAVNQGKGRALKTAFNYLLNEVPDCPGAVTVDSDGQHRIADIITVARTVISRPNSLVMGCRDFSGKNPNIPPRSQFGNRTTSRVLRLFCGISLSDTQTGLRGFSPASMRHFLSTKGERFEYEMNMILDAHDAGIPLVQVPIETVYLEENRSSHFNPLLDSFRIYAVFLKFIAASLSSYVVDIAAFSLILLLLGWAAPSLAEGAAIVIATYSARVLSAIFNFTINKKTVFKSRAKIGGCIVRYCLLSILIVSLSAFATSGLADLLNWNAVPVKLIVDSILFLLSFRVQRSWVFR